MNYFQFGLLSLVSGAANKIHTCCSAHSNGSTFHTTARRFPGLVNEASSRERGKREEKEGGTPRPPSPCPAAAGSDQRESIGHFSPIAPLQTSRRACCNNVQMSSVRPLCETITTGCSVAAAVFTNSSNFAFEVGITTKPGTLWDGSA